jgi:hypothetical protein
METRKGLAAQNGDNFGKVLVVVEGYRSTFCVSFIYRERLRASQGHSKDGSVDHFSDNPSPWLQCPVSSLSFNLLALSRPPATIVEHALHLQIPSVLTQKTSRYRHYRCYTRLEIILPPCEFFWELFK